MAYNPQTWIDGVAGGTPLSAARLNAMEQGIAAAQNSTDAALRDRSTHTGTQAQSTITNLTTDLAAKAPTASPTFTGTVSGVTKAHVGLGNADNTSDANKPVSTAAAAALAAKISSTTIVAFEARPTIPAFDPAEAGYMFAVPTNGA